MRGTALMRGTLMRGTSVLVKGCQNVERLKGTCDYE